MRIDLVHEVLASNTPYLTVQSAKPDNQTVRVSNFARAIDAVRSIHETGMFSELCDEILSNVPIVLAVQDPIVVSTQTFTKFNQPLSRLRNKAQVVWEALDEYVRDVPPESIYVKLPETTNLDQTAELFQEIDTMLNQILVNDYLEGQVRLERFADGSLWIVLFLGSLTAYRFVAGMVNIYFDVKKKQTEQNTRQIELENLKLESEVRSSVLEAMKTEIESHRESRLRELLEEHEVPEDDNEFALRTENSLRMLGSLLERGLEINPALSAPAEEQERLPDPKLILEAIRALPSAEPDETVGNGNSDE